MSEYQIGRLLLTSETKRWSQEQRDQADAIERTMIFKNFTSSDEGRGRQIIATCVSQDAAKDLVGLIESLQQENAKLKADNLNLVNMLESEGIRATQLMKELEAVKEQMRTAYPMSDTVWKLQQELAAIKQGEGEKNVR